MYWKTVILQNSAQVHRENPSNSPEEIEIVGENLNPRLGQTWKALGHIETVLQLQVNSWWVFSSEEGGRTDLYDILC